jgi:hypothetical protein
VCEVLDINTMEYHVLYAEASGDELDTPVIDSVSPEDITSLSGSSELEDSEPADEELPEEGGDE